MSKKIILNLPAKGYTGETIKHTVSATDLKNNPELEVLGVKAGDEIEILPTTDDSITASTSGAKTNSDVKTVGKKDKSNRAEEIASKYNIEKVFENTETGDFFTTENLALLSAGGKKSIVKTHNF